METSNKIIAEFIGNRNYLYNNDKSAMYFILTNTAGEELIVNYDNDWGLLMEVVEKIESLHESNNVLIGTNITYVQIHNKVSNEQETFKGVSNIKIEAVYNTCVEFIKWYNKNAVKR